MPHRKKEGIPFQSSGLFFYTYIRQEAVLSPEIEGTQSSLSDLLQHGLDQLKNGTPLSLRLFRDIHARLLAHGRGSSKQPGEFRRSQNRMGGSRPGNASFVPSPPDAVIE